ncbi:KilA-N domain-containing protein [Paludibacterium denitrificans]|uniref:KilA-N domain-containing protein n=1 Tax=Paludibacterium denitrificans TaxID=2675226 RepID=A0A844GG00_9NEIS|nr:KilA-N domain-containing protein [Paludibacterium denitrificans]MTD33435.1 hypothetical protein [Paludibacterium denitrificans]
MTTNTKLLVIAGITIKTDSEGRYCLNDFHKAAGGEERHSPWRFLRLDTTAELIDELQSTTSGGLEPVAAKAGRYGGTFVAKELVYAYAMWISPSFHLKVIRTFDELHTKGIVMTQAVVVLQKAGNRYPRDHQKDGTNAPDRRDDAHWRPLPVKASRSVAPCLVGCPLGGGAEIASQRPSCDWMASSPHYSLECPMSNDGDRE